MHNYEQKFKDGELVLHTSGGPTMTVVAGDSYYDRGVLTRYWDSTQNKFVTATLLLHELERYTNNE